MSLLPNDPAAPEAWHGDMSVPSRYTFGLAGERFFRALKDEGKILGARCDRCQVSYVPARQFCERCMAELEDWHDAGTQGEVHAFTRLAVDLDGSPRSQPELIAFVRIEDGGLVHRLGEVDPDEVRIGMQVEAVLKAPGEREGSIHDIQHFRPVQV